MSTRTLTLVIAALVLGQAPALPQLRPESTMEPAAVLTAERAWAGADVLLPLTRTADTATAAAALRALGRLENPALIPQLLPFADARDPSIRAAAANAIAQSLEPADAHLDLATLTTVVDALQRHASTADPAGVAALGRIAYPNPDFVSGAEALFDKLLDDTASDKTLAGLRAETLVAFESLARRNARVPGVRFAPETLARLESAVEGTHVNDGDHQRLYALLTMIDSGSLTADAERAALADTYDQVRRIGVKALGGSGVSISDDERSAALRHAVVDDSVLVRYEAVQAYAKKSAVSGGCGPLIDALQDASAHVADAALDALGTACVGNEDVTIRVAAESRTPPAIGEWQREAHAFVALAKRDPDRARMALAAFTDHPVWQVRMYAARAAAVLKDEPMLARLALDDSDNVRDAALGPLQTIAPDRAEPAILDALKRTDPQLLRSAARMLKQRPSSHALYRPLADAFLRITREQSQTTRDARMALLDAIEVHGRADDAGDLVNAARDVDPAITLRVSELLARWGRTIAAQPIPIVHSGVRPVPELRQCVAVSMRNGRTFRLSMANDNAPVTVGTFLKLALVDRLYDGLTFHRVEPNFVVQGGSPGANEYSSPLKTFLRDEIGLPNIRGAVGLSIRGRNTADGQIYIMLVDEPRLDGGYTIFAHVFGRDMGVVDDIQEGDVISEMKPVSCQP